MDDARLDVAWVGNSRSDVARADDIWAVVQGWVRRGRMVLGWAINGLMFRFFDDSRCDFRRRAIRGGMFQRRLIYGRMFRGV